MPTVAASRLTFLQNRIARFEDQQAYKELFISLYPNLFSLVSGIIKSKPAAEEVISDVFIKIWEKRKELDLILNLKVYCFVSARNLSLNYLEKQKRFATLNIEDFADSTPTSIHLDPHELMITSEMLQRITKSVDELPARCKMVFVLIKENGFKYKEVAEIMKLSVKTVENQLAIALKKISLSINFDLSRSMPMHSGTRN